MIGTVQYFYVILMKEQLIKILSGRIFLHLVTQQNCSSNYLLMH